MVNGGHHEGAIHVGDIDMWTFEADAGDFVTVRLGEMKLTVPVDEITWYESL